MSLFLLVPLGVVVCQTYLFTKRCSLPFLVKEDGETFRSVYQAMGKTGIFMIVVLLALGVGMQFVALQSVGSSHWVTSIMVCRCAVCLSV